MPRCGLLFVGSGSGSRTQPSPGYEPSMQADAPSRNLEKKNVELVLQSVFPWIRSDVSALCPKKKSEFSAVPTPDVSH